MHPAPLIVSDVDGTLMDARGQFPGHPGHFGEIIRKLDLVLASSRTLAELLHIQQALGHRGALLAENGALVAYDDGWMDLHEGTPMSLHDRTLRVIELGAPAAQVEPLVREAAEHSGLSFRTLREVLEDEFGAPGKHSREEMERALDRTHSVLIEPRGTHATVLDFRARLARSDCRAAVGGRWTVVVQGSDKGDAVRALRDRVRAVRAHVRVAGIGNAENDVPLLSACDDRFVVRGDDASADAALAAVPGAVVLDRPGIDGWLEMLDRLGSTPDTGAHP